MDTYSDIPSELLARLMAIRSEREFRELIEEHPELLPVIQQMANKTPVPQETLGNISISVDLKALLQELQRLTRLSDMTRRIELCQEALRLVNRETQPELWAGLQVELGNSFYQNQLGERAYNIERAIERAIEHYERALEVYTREAFPEKWALTQHNLALAYSDRIRGERADNIERAIEHYERALEVYTREAFPEKWALTQNNLANAYWSRIRGEQADNIERAIEHCEHALEVRTREAFPEKWAGTQNNLANAYRSRIRGERADNIERAIEHYERALEVYTRKAFPEDWALTQNNLALAYSDRIRGERADNIERAIEHYEHALEVRRIEQFPADRRQTLRNLGDLHFSEQGWDKALANYNEAIEAGNAVLAEAYTEVGRKAEVAETSRLYARSAYCLLRSGQTAKAILRLEEGKTRLLTEAMALAGADIAMLSKGQADDIKKKREAVRLLEAEMRLSSDSPGRRSNAELADLLRRARADINAFVSVTRSQHPEFMPASLDLPGIMGLIPEDGALVAPLITSMGSAVFVIPHGTDTVGTEHVVPLDSLDEADLLRLLQGRADDTGLGGWMGAYFNFRVESTKTATEHWLEVIEKSTSKLWTMLMGPVHEKLMGLKMEKGAPVLLLPQGYLGLLPLHAAWREIDGQKRAFMDDYTVTYAPSAYAFSISRQRMQVESRHEPSLLAVINPTEDLPYTPMEGKAIKAFFDPIETKTLSENKATKKAVLEYAPEHTYLHFSCHGFYDWQNVMGSGLMLANNDTLTLSDIISELKLNRARLVTLSACETGMTDVGQSPDEFIGLPTGFLQAGAPGVVSTLWAVNDAATSLLMEHFYRKHLKRGLPPGQALRSAQLWLRDATRQKLGETYKSLTRMSPHEAYRELVLTGDPGDKPYANPYFWAAFTFTGV